MELLNKDIIIQASEGDINSFEIIFKNYSNYVFNMVLRMVKNKEQAEEISQDVFVNIYKNLKNFKFKSSFTTWVYRIAINMTLNYIKKEKKHSGQVQYNDSFNFISKNEITENFKREDEKSLIERLLNFLTPDQKACIVLRNIEGLSYIEISQVLNININAVRSRLKRAREKLLLIRKEVIKNEL